VKGTLFAVQKALPLFRNNGSIMMTGSIASIKGMGQLSAYAASKAALHAFARTWTNELKSRGIRVNVISPGPIETGVFEGIPNDRRSQMVSMIPMGRIGRPEEIATTALFLASEDSSFITGVELCVDGGMAQV
jgi:NAD(P)-dependent dehydrogenase (short-subunit alcohol dehydrogenase family)